MSYTSTVNTNTNNMCHTACTNNIRSTSIRNRTLRLRHRTFAFNLYNVLKPFHSKFSIEKVSANIAVWRAVFEPFGVAICFDYFAWNTTRQYKCATNHWGYTGVPNTTCNTSMPNTLFPRLGVGQGNGIVWMVLALVLMVRTKWRVGLPTSVLLYNCRSSECLFDMAGNNCRSKTLV